MKFWGIMLVRLFKFIPEQKLNYILKKLKPCAV